MTTVLRQVGWIEWTLLAVVALLGIAFVSLPTLWEIGYSALFAATVLTLWAIFRPGF